MFGSSKSTYDPETETADLKGKVVIVTGGNSGVGFEAVKHLAAHGAKVYMASRNETRANDAVKALREAGVLERGSVEVLLMDLNSLKDVKRAADEFAAKEPKLHILVNNAGMLAQYAHSVSAEGIVDPSSTNYFGHFLLTTMLLPQLKAAAREEGSDVRVVMNSSGSIKFPPTISKLDSLEDLDICKENGFSNAMKRYGMSKVCGVWFVRELQRRFDEENIPIIVMAADPGAVASPGVLTSLGLFPGPIKSLAWGVTRALSSSPAVGAHSTQFAASSVKVREEPAKYKAALLLPPNQITPLKGQVADEARPKELWALSERVINEVLTNGRVQGAASAAE